MERMRGFHKRILFNKDIGDNLFNDLKDYGLSKFSEDFDTFLRTEYEKIQESHIFYADAMQKIIRRVENDN
jgi:hypothetical protein